MSDFHADDVQLARQRLAIQDAVKFAIAAKDEEIAALKSREEAFLAYEKNRDDEVAKLRAKIAALQRENKIAISALTAIRPYIEREAKVEKSPWAIVGMMHVDAALSASARPRRA